MTEYSKSDSTINMYNKALERLNKLNLDITNYSNILNYLHDKYDNNSTKKLYILAIINKLRETSDNNDCITKYIEEINKINSIETQKSDNEVYDKDILDWNDILFCHKTLEKLQTHKYRMQQYTILSIYIMNPPRRLKDINLLIYKKENKDINDNNNYYIADDSIFQFGNFKTIKSLGVQKILIKSELKNILDNYIEKLEIKDNSLMFKLSVSQFTSRISSIFSEFLGKKFTVNDIRHSFINELYKNGAPNMTTMKYYVEQLGQKNIISHLNYRRNKTPNVINYNEHFNI